MGYVCSSGRQWWEPEKEDPHQPRKQRNKRYFQKYFLISAADEMKSWLINLHIGAWQHCKSWMMRPASDRNSVMQLAGNLRLAHSQLLPANCFTDQYIWFLLMMHTKYGTGAPDLFCLVIPVLVLILLPLKVKSLYMILFHAGLKGLECCEKKFYRLWEKTKLI